MSGFAEVCTSAFDQTYFAYHGLGSTTDQTVGTGAVTDTYSYDIFGAVRARAGTNTSPWKFTGEQDDGATGDTGYYFLRARYLDTATGRFISRDPLEFDQRYGYASGNPVLASDRNGMCGEDCSFGELTAKGKELAATYSCTPRFGHHPVCVGAALPQAPSFFEDPSTLCADSDEGYYNFAAGWYVSVGMHIDCATGETHAQVGVGLKGTLNLTGSSDPGSPGVGCGISLLAGSLGLNFVGRDGLTMTPSREIGLAFPGPGCNWVTPLKASRQQ